MIISGGVGTRNNGSRLTSEWGEDGPERAVFTRSDMAGYSHLTPDAQRDHQIRLAEAQRRAAANARVDRARARVQGAGDGEQTRWPAGTEALRIAIDYVRELNVELGRINGGLAANNQLRVRLAVVEGMAEEGAYGQAGGAPILAARLVDAQQAKDALRLAPDCHLVVILQDRLYEDLVQANYRGLKESEYVRVVVEHTDKNFRQAAYITLPGANRPPILTDPQQEPIVREDPPAPARWRRWPPKPWPAVVAAAIVTALGTVLAALIARSPDAAARQPPPTTSVVTSIPTTTPSTTSSTVAPTNTVSGSHTETADNRLGIQTFADNLGTPSGKPVLPFAAQVQVDCYSPNNSGMASINAFYHIVGPTPWQNTYAPANTFANGDPLGVAGSTQIDTAVPRCVVGQ
jgi:class 3 adenylate cyclase